MNLESFQPVFSFKCSFCLFHFPFSFRNSIVYKLPCFQVFTDLWGAFHFSLVFFLPSLDSYLQLFWLFLLPLRSAVKSSVVFCFVLFCFVLFCFHLSYTLQLQNFYLVLSLQFLSTGSLHLVGQHCHELFLSKLYPLVLWHIYWAWFKIF